MKITSAKDLTVYKKSYDLGMRIFEVTKRFSLDPRTQMPLPYPSHEVKRVTWVDFQFEGTRISALAFLKKTLSGIREISEQIETLE